MSVAKKIIKKSIKISLILLTGLLVLLGSAWIYLNTDSGKKMLRDQVQNYLQKKLLVTVSIGAVDFEIPDWIRLNKVYIEDKKKDTLLYGEELYVELKMLKLIKGETAIQSILLNNVFANINRPATDSAFNYEFIIDAFSSTDKAVDNADTAALKLSLDKLTMRKIRVVYEDRYGGTDLYANIDSLELLNDVFKPDRLCFGIKKLTGDGIRYSMKNYKAVATPVETNEPASPFILNAKNISLSNIEASVTDSIEGFYTVNKLKTFTTENISVDGNTRQASIDLVSLQNGAVQFTQSKISKKITAKPAPDNEPSWSFRLNKLDLENTAVKYDDNHHKPTGGFDVNHLDIKQLNVSVNSIVHTADSTSATLARLTFKDAGGFAIDSTRADFFMSKQRLSVNGLYVKTPNSLLQNSLDLRFDNLDDILKKPKNSLITATIGKSVVAFKDLYLLYPDLKNTLPVRSFSGQSIYLNTGIKGNLSRLYIPHFTLSGLSGSNISAKGTLYNITQPEKLSYNLDILSSKFIKKDIQLFVPAENIASLKDLPPFFTLKGNLTGNMKNLAANIHTQGEGVGFSGKIDVINFSDPSKMTYSLNARNVTVDKKFLSSYIPADVLKQFTLPPSLSLSGSLGGNVNDIKSAVTLKSSFGAIGINGYLKNISDTKAAKYDLDISAANLSVGKFLKMDAAMGNFTGYVKAKGTGFDYKTMQTDAEAGIKSFNYQGYTYKNALLKARFNKGEIESNGSINDPNIRLSYTVSADVHREYPLINAEIKVDTAQLKELGLLDNLFNLSGKIAINSRNLTPRNLDAGLVMDNIFITTPNGHYPFNSITLLATSSSGIDSINLNAPFAKIKSGGAFDYPVIGDALIQRIFQYSKIPGLTASTEKFPEQDFGFSGYITHDTIFNTLVPGLNYFDTIQLAGKFNSNELNPILKLRAKTSGISYETNDIKVFSLDINNNNSKLTGLANIDTLQNENISFYSTKVKTILADDIIKFDALTRDENLLDWFGVTGDLKYDGENIKAELTDDLLLNYDYWSVAPDNYFLQTPEGIIVHDFLLSRDSARIYVNSESLVPNSPLLFDIDNFNLNNINTYLRSDTNFISGNLDVKLKISELDKAVPAFVGTADIEELNVLGYQIGNISASASKPNDDQISTQVKLQGNENDITADGSYFLDNPSQDLDMNLSVNKLDMKTLQAFSEGQLIKSSGNIQGKFAIKGKFDNPEWSGFLKFDTVSSTIAELGTPFKIENQRIIFRQPQIKFNDFTIKDSMNNPLRVNGNVALLDNNDIGLGLTLNAKNFILLNAKRKMGSQLYGYASANASMSISGKASAPNIEGDIFVNDKSNVTIVLPDGGYVKDDVNAIVRFVDRDTFTIYDPGYGFIPERKASVDLSGFLNYNVNVEINKNASLKIIVDPSTGDEILVQGDAHLNAGVDPGGNIVLAGNYELDKGHYVLNYQFLKKQFNLVKGSTIVFGGSPMDASINLIAESIANASAQDLLSNELKDISPTVAHLLKQKIPFRVMLLVSGKINKPTISFDIQVSEQNAAINSEVKTAIEHKLAEMRQDPAATNKQVFSLLLFNKFLNEQSIDFFKSSAGDFTDIAKKSVSQFVSSAINEIAGDLFKGIDVDLNLNSYNDYTKGGNEQRTDLNVAISKSFLNNRLNVTIGNNFGLAGISSSSNSVNNNAVFRPDINVAYKLSKDGKYMVRAYTKNQFEVILDGYVIETGASFLVTLDYEKFKELFRKNTAD